MTDSEWIANIHNFSNAEIFEQLEQIGCDGYYRDIWSACIEELRRRANLTSGDLISRSALKKKLEEMANNEWNIQVGSSKGLEDAIDVIENAPTVETDIEVATKDAYDHGYTDGWKERFGEPDERSQGEFTRKELESWLYQIAFNNTDNELSRYCEEIISRLDGFERFVADMRGDDNGKS